MYLFDDIQIDGVSPGYPWVPLKFGNFLIFYNLIFIYMEYEDCEI